MGIISQQRQIGLALCWLFLAVFRCSPSAAFSTQGRSLTSTPLRVPSAFASLASSHVTCVTNFRGDYHFQTQSPIRKSLRLCAKSDKPSSVNISKKRWGADDEMFNIRTTFALVGGQAVLVGIAVGIAALLRTPNFGFGPGIAFTAESVAYGTFMSLPLGAFAWVLDRVEGRFPALQDVTTATQRSVLALMGSTFKPGLGLLVATSLGVAAGLGEEMLFRGVLQYELGNRFGDIVAVGLASIVFGLLHAVTPLYAGLASLASIYFGYLYLASGNLAVPIMTHAVYDILALMYAHWTVAQLSKEEQTALAEWAGPGEKE